MSNIKAAASRSFHNYIDREVLTRRSPIAHEVHETKHIVVTKRDVSYSFDYHQHPFVRDLMQRTIRGGTRGLQAADTDYVADTTLPGSARIRFEASRIVVLMGGSKITLLDPVSTTAEGVAVDLSAGMQFTIRQNCKAAVSEETSAVLSGAPDGFPRPGSKIQVAGGAAASLLGDSNATLDEGATVTLHDGRLAPIPTGTNVSVSQNSLFHFPMDSEVSLLSVLPLPLLHSGVFSASQYEPSQLVSMPYPAKDIDFSVGGAYACYNWELFFHVPLTIAVHLSKNQRFAEAQHWFHYLFDPTDDSDDPTPERFWKVKPFQSTDVKKIEEILINLATGADKQRQTETVRSIEAWKDAPFRPHVIARYRQQAYMYKTVMAYLDNLIAWGDSLFRQDTGEAIDEAMMIYILAANILGPRPLPIPKKGKVRSQTYANLRDDLKEFGTAIREMEADIAFDLMPFPAENTGDDRTTITQGLGKALYFCVPRNDKVLGYWDTISDRLFKIRNSQNLQGAFRRLALFEPPIDPAMLVRAAAGGLDVGAIVSGANQPAPLVRFQLLAQKASEITQEVKSLGASLLAAMEKEDGEAMTLLRAKHERHILEMAEQIRYAQLQEAIKSREGLLVSLASAVQRYTFYELQLGKKLDDVQKSIPELEELDTAGLEKMRFAMKEAELTAREMQVDTSDDLESSGGKLISSFEAQELEKLADARLLQEVVQGIQLGGQAISLLPQFGIKFHFWGLGGDTSYGGFNLGKIAQFAANVTSAMADKKTYEAGNAAKIGSYARRELEWAFQSNAAAGEINQIFKQIRAAQIREAISEAELKSHRQQMKQADEIDRFLNSEGARPDGKKTNLALYTWLKRETKGIYSQCYQLAYDVAKKAERALRIEVGDNSLNYLQFGYLSGKEGLLAGEKLYFDIKRMEAAYHDLDQRRFEMTRHISLLQLDPLALVRLRSTGTCDFRIPEEYFDIDCPGHYFRRIKTVAISIPCIVGPYSSVNCTLKLKSSKIRVKTDSTGYADETPEDRFDNYHSVREETIVTSSAQNDSGLFETNLRDERYLPFENAGVISDWELSLPANPSKNEPSHFDYETITDVILHMRYTSRYGGDELRTVARENIATQITNITEQSDDKRGYTTRILSVRHEFPSEWSRFTAQTAAGVNGFELNLELLDEHYPFWSRTLRSNAEGPIKIIARPKSDSSPTDLKVFVVNADETLTDHLTLIKDETLGGLLSVDAVAANARRKGNLKLFFTTKKLKDLWIAIRWKADE